MTSYKVRMHIHFKQINSQYKKKEFIRQPFYGRLNEIFGTIIYKHRTYEIEKELNNELNSNRERTNEITGIIDENHEIYNLLNKNPNFTATRRDQEIWSKRIIVNKYRLLIVYRKIFGTCSYGEDARACECISAI